MKDEPELDHDLIRRNAEWRTRKEQLTIMTTYARRLELVVCTLLTTAGLRAWWDEPLTVPGVGIIAVAIVVVPLLLAFGPARRFKPS